jgi:ribosomal-protein-alanine N-acetyltransferase
VETTRTLFSKPQPSDYGDLLELYTNDRVREYLGGALTKDEFDATCTKLFSTNPESWYWVVRQKESDNLVGLISIGKHHDKIHFEISYELHPDFWGMGYGTEIVTKGIEYAFAELEINELYAETQKRNMRSIQLLEKLGMAVVTEVERFGEQQIIFSIKK